MIFCQNVVNDGTDSVDFWTGQVINAEKLKGQAETITVSVLSDNIFMQTFICFTWLCFGLKMSAQADLY